MFLLQPYLCAIFLFSASLVRASPSPNPLWTNPLKVRDTCENTDCIQASGSLLACLSPDVTNDELLSCFCPNNFVAFTNCVLIDDCLITDSYGYFESQNMDNVLDFACTLYVNGFQTQAASCLASQDQTGSSCDLSQIPDSGSGGGSSTPPLTFTSGAGTSTANRAASNTATASNAANTNAGGAKKTSGAASDCALQVFFLGAIALGAAAVLL